MPSIEFTEFVVAVVVVFFFSKISNAEEGSLFSLLEVTVTFGFSFSKASFVWLVVNTTDLGRGFKFDLSSTGSVVIVVGVFVDDTVLVVILLNFSKAIDLGRTFTFDSAITVLKAGVLLLLAVGGEDDEISVVIVFVVEAVVIGLGLIGLEVGASGFEVGLLNILIRSAIEDFTVGCEDVVLLVEEEFVMELEFVAPPENICLFSEIDFTVTFGLVTEFDVEEEFVCTLAVS
jgi:hypothetical protein